MDEATQKVKQLASAISRLTNTSQKIAQTGTSFDNLSDSVKRFIGSTSKIKNLEETTGILGKLSNAIAKLRKNSGGSSGNLGKITVQTQTLNNRVSRLRDNLKKITDIISIAFLMRVYNIISRIGSAVYNLVKLYAEYQENINLATVAYNGLEGAAKSLYPFVEQISTAFGLNESEVVRSVGLFKQMANAMGLAQETGELLSETLTKMAYDISSLYNISFERSMSVLQASLAGQTKPIRGATGADITESSLRKTLQNIGIKKEIRDLSYVEKRLLIVISLTQQLNNAQGDLHRTIESTANQLKIMQQQLQRLKIALGDFFNIFAAKILPYINGFLMALIEIIKWINTLVKALLGVQDMEYDYDSIGTGSDYVDELVDGLEEADDAAKKLKKNLVGIDELNILEEQETDDNMGIDPDILAAFNAALADWDNKMSETEMKAYKIRDAILSWFGLEPIGDGLWGLKDGASLARFISDTLSNLNLDRVKQLLKYLAEALGIILALKIALSPFVLMTTGLLLIMDGINKMLGETKELSKGLTEILGGVALILLGLAIKFGSFPLLVAAAIAGGLAWFISQMTDEQLQGLMDKLKEIYDNIKLWIEEFIADFPSKIDKIKDFVQDLMGKIKEMVDNFIKNLPNIAAILGGLGVLALAPMLVQIFKGAAGAFTPFMLKLAGIGLILTGIATAIEGVVKMIKEGKITLEGLMQVIKGVGIAIAGIGILTGNPLLIAIGAIVAIVAALNDETSTFGNAIKNLWNTILKPVLERLWGELQRIWEKLKPALQHLWELVKAVWDILMVLVSVIIDLLGPAIQVIASLFIDVFGGAIEVIIDILDFLITILGGVADFIAGILTGDIDRALKGIGNIFVGFVNGIIAILEAGINFVIIVVNAFVGAILGVIKGIYNVIAGTIEGIAKLAGINIDIKWKSAVPQIPMVSIPRVSTFENGGYPNKGMFLMNEGSSAEMLGTIGGRTAVVNNEEIANALAKALTPLLGTVVTAIEDVAATDRPLVLNVDSRDIARANNTGSQKLGSSQLGGVFANV